MCADTEHSSTSVFCGSVNFRAIQSDTRRWPYGERGTVGFAGGRPFVFKGRVFDVGFALLACSEKIDHKDPTLDNAGSGTRKGTMQEKADPSPLSG